MTPEDSLLLRFIKHPSVFDIPDDEEGAQRVVEAIALELEPDPKRELDGRTSWWETGNSKSEDYVKAGFAVRRTRQRLSTLRIPRTLVEQVDIRIESVSDKSAFSCIEHLHRELLLSENNKVHQFAHALTELLASSKSSGREVVNSISRSDLREFIRTIYQNCIVEGGDPDMHKAESWVIDFLRSN